ncbi:hypothetical protein AHiyo8_48580 [Arthrobacter sp. Hiyo8]|uniref:hypothetical protein n=1 Tax=Arthrobacter sp. Hiyo1 TaxID=1588020 RepID=UPI0006838F3E|nr:hypothetical protein [Arthrobacter sp. Hiyo1]BAS16555.1 hypothetical protein AHiyo8_48580 [Arthrobacter sp. Hiyo8]GAP57305.1 hypothetical protein AHiyo1_01300 [Arthrobacter sp. Hiyo1]
MSQQKTLADLQSMTTEQIVEAHSAGVLDDLLRGGTPETVAARKQQERTRQAEAISDAEAARIDGANEPGARNYGGKV